MDDKEQFQMIQAYVDSLAVAVTNIELVTALLDKMLAFLDEGTDEKSALYKTCELYKNTASHMKQDIEITKAFLRLKDITENEGRHE